MDDLPPDSKLTRSRRRWAEEHKFADATPPTGRERLPPGQHLVTGWPVLDLGETPDIRTQRWRLEIGGLVERPVALDWAGFTALPQTRSRSDIHCVTTWSRYDNDWTGVRARDLLDLVTPLPEARATSPLASRRPSDGRSRTLACLRHRRRSLSVKPRSRRRYGS